MMALEFYALSVPGKRHEIQSGLFVAQLPQGSGGEAMAPRRVSVLVFGRRFTPAEKATIEWAAVDGPNQPEAHRMQAAALRATLADQAAATFIDLDDSATVEGLESLETMAILARGRAREILTTPIQPEEVP